MLKAYFQKKEHINMPKAYFLKKKHIEYIYNNSYIRKNYANRHNKKQKI